DRRAGGGPARGGHVHRGRARLVRLGRGVRGRVAQGRPDGRAGPGADGPLPARLRALPATGRRGPRGRAGGQMSKGVYERLGVARVINASGRMTHLGGSHLADEVADGMAEAGRGYVRLADLHERAGQLIAGHTGAEAACVTTGAAAGIALMVAACVAGADPAAVELLPEVAHDRREVLVQIGHMVSFGAPVAQMIRLAGGRPIAVG